MYDVDTYSDQRFVWNITNCFFFQSRFYVFNYFLNFCPLQSFIFYFFVLIEMSHIRVHTLSITFIRPSSLHIWPSLTAGATFYTFLKKANLKRKFFVISL